MNEAALDKAFSKPFGKKGAENLAAFCAEHDQVPHLIGLTILPDRQAAFRAAWVLEHLQAAFPNAFLKEIAHFLALYPRQKNPGCQRSYTKIMMQLTSPGAKQETKKALCADLDLLVEATFDWLIDHQTPVAVQVNCMDILFNLRQKFPWISEELKSQIQFLLINGSAAMQSRGKRILKRLK